MKIIIIFVLAFLMAGCEKSPKIQARNADVQILNDRYPVGYPSSSKMENKVVGILGRGMCIEVLSVGYEKDFKYYKVRLESGDAGYVIHSGNVTECKERGK